MKPLSSAPDRLPILDPTMQPTAQWHYSGLLLNEETACYRAQY